MKGILTALFLAVPFCSYLPQDGIIGVPVNTSEGQLGTALLGRASYPAPCTVLGFETAADSMELGNRVQVSANERKILVKILDAPIPD